MPTILETLGSIDLGSLSARIDAAQGTVSIEADLSQFDPAALLGELGKLARSTDFPRDPQEIVRSIRDGISELGNLIQIPPTQASVAVFSQIEGLLAVLQRMVEDLSGDLDGLLNSLMEDSGSLSGILTEMVDRVMSTIPAQIPELARGPFQALQTLAQRKPSTPSELANAISMIVTGINLDDLNAPAVKLNEFLDRVRTAGGGLIDLEFHWNAVTARARAVTELLRQSGVDEAAVILELHEIRVTLDFLFANVLPGAMAKLTTDLSGLNPAALYADLRNVTGALLAKFPQAPFNLEEAVLEGLGEALAIIENTSAEDLNARIAELEAHARSSFRDSGLASIPERIDSLFDLLIEGMREVPIGRLRHQLVDGIAELETKVRNFTGFALPYKLAEHLAKLEAAIDDIDLTAVQQNVQKVTESINEAVQKFPILEIKQDIETVLGSVTEVVDQFAPVFDQVSSRMDELALKIESVDISVAGDASIGLMKEIRTNVEAAVGSADLPEPARLAIVAAATALKEVNLSVEISQPFNSALGQIDASALLQPLEEVVTRVREVLEKVTPQSLIEKLDEPFLQLQKKLETLKPSALLGHISVEFDRLLDVLKAADPRTLVGPLEAEFQKLLSTLRKASDPAILFAPLRALYAKLQELLKLIDFKKLFEALSRKLVGLPSAVRDSLKTAVATRGGTSVDTAVGVNLGQIKVGDFLRPVALLIAQLRKLATELAQDVVSGAFSLLRVPLQAILNLADPALGVLGIIARQVDQRIQALDIFAASGPAAELRLALQDLQTAAASASFSTAGRAQLGLVLATVQLDVRAPDVAPLQAAMAVQRNRLSGELPPPDLHATVQQLGGIIKDLFPLELAEANASADVTTLIRKLFDSFDPTPLADKLDALGARAVAKLESLANEILRAIVRLVSTGFELIDTFTPAGMLNRLNANLDRVKAEFAVIDPAPIEAEIRKLIDAVIDCLKSYSPANLAGQLGGLFDSVQQKIASLNPATLLGDLSAIDAVIDQFAQLRPTLVLGPLLDSTKEIQAALAKTASFDPGETLVRAVANLHAQLGDIVDGIEAELRALIDYFEGLAGGINVNISVSASID
jgi:hypothetical protein